MGYFMIVLLPIRQNAYVLSHLQGYIQQRRALGNKINRISYDAG
jgi:hypothetical protein